MKKLTKILSSIFFLCMVSVLSFHTSSKDIEAAQRTTKAYKKYLGKWETVDYKMNVKTINKNYLKATITAKNKDKITIDQKMKVTKKNTFYVTSKKGIEVKVIMKFKYGKPYKDYKRNTVVDGPQIHLAGNSKAWSSNTYYKEDKKGNIVPVMLVYTKTLKKKK